MKMNDKLEALATELEQSKNYRVLRRLEPKTEFEQATGEKTFFGVVLDTETTGLTPHAEIIELGMVKFSYSATGAILKVVDRFDALQQPKSPIPAEVARLTKITNDMVADRLIDPNAVKDFITDASLVIAHNSGFDRPIVERTWSFFEEKNWACSLREIPWRQYNFESCKLGHLLADCGLFHDGHRAIEDCEALLHLLSLPLGEADKPALALLLERARKTSVRIWAKDAPFSTKEALKARGYAWADGAVGSLKAWWIDVDQEAYNTELEFLRAEVFRNPNALPPRAIVTARDRYSKRLSPE
jgi:DNA polymerase-3 subunit epsilon